MVDKDEDFEDIVDGVEGKTSHCFSFITYQSRSSTRSYVRF